jgi:hypothetical protein
MCVHMCMCVRGRENRVSARNCCECVTGMCAGTMATLPRAAPAPARHPVTMLRPERTRHAAASHTHAHAPQLLRTGYPRIIWCCWCCNWCCRPAHEAGSGPGGGCGGGSAHIAGAGGPRPAHGAGGGMFEGRGSMNGGGIPVMGTSTTADIIGRGTRSIGGGAIDSGGPATAAAAVKEGAAEAGAGWGGGEGAI